MKADDWLLSDIMPVEKKLINSISAVGVFIAGMLEFGKAQIEKIRCPEKPVKPAQNTVFHGLL